MARVSVLAGVLLAAHLVATAAGQEAQGPTVPPAVPPAAETPGAWRPEQFDVRIPVRDGATLAADVYLPAKPGRYPAVVIQTPYDRTRHRRGLGGGQGGFGDADRAGLTAFADRERYAYVISDWRGFFGSRAAGTPRPGSQARDGFDVVEWAAAQTWCDGKIGTWGPSALGGVQFQMATERPSHLVCAVPIVAAHGHRYEDYFESGVLREHHLACLGRLGFTVGGRVRDDRARNPAAPLYALARTTERLDRIDVPLLMITGWFDHGTERQLGTFQEILNAAGPRARAESRMLVGPWHHTAVDAATQGDLAFPAAAGAAADAVRAWFAKWLRGEGDGGWAADERVRFWRCGEDGWTSAPAWPRAGAGRRALTLHADGRIDEKAPAGEASRSFLDDPADPSPTVGGANLPQAGVTAGPRDQRGVVARADVLAYSTAPLDASVRIEGASTLTAWIRTDAPDADLAVRLCETGPDGRTILLADSIARASFAPHAEARNSVYRPVEPGEPCEMTVQLPPLAVTIAKGSRLTLLLSGSNWPRFERIGHTGRGVFEADTAVAAKVEVLHDAAHPARFEFAEAPRAGTGTGTGTGAGAGPQPAPTPPK